MRVILGPLAIAIGSIATACATLVGIGGMYSSNAYAIVFGGIGCTIGLLTIDAGIRS